MDEHSLVVIGGSAGALEPVRAIVKALPRSFPAAVLVVIHYPDDAPSSLAAILARSGTLPASTLRDDQELLPGHIGVGPPGRHAVVSERRVVLQTGPRENGQRPSIDVLFRSAARAYGARATGVVLSGTLGDGSLGLAEIVRCGGHAFVQAPSEASYDSMPLSAIRNVSAAEVAPASTIAARLIEIAGAEPVASAEAALPESEPVVRTRLSCPDCGLPLGEVHRNPAAFRCRAGHAYTNASLAEATHRAGETALWQAIRTHEERVDILHRLEASAFERHDAPMADTYRRLAEEARDLAMRLRSVIGQEPCERRLEREDPGGS